MTLPAPDPLVACAAVLLPRLSVAAFARAAVPAGTCGSVPARSVPVPPLGTQPPVQSGRSVASFRAGPPRATIARMALIETEEAARRLARAIASDLSLYNEEKIVQGIQGDNLFEALSEEIEEGRALFKSRVAPELYARGFYDRAIIDVLVRSKGHVQSKMW